MSRLHHMMQGVAGLAACATVAMLAATGAAAGGVAGSPVPVKTDPKVSEWMPAADGPWVGWAQHGNYFAQRGSQPRVRVNPRGTAISGLIYGLHFGAGIEGRELVYAQTTTRGGSLGYDIWKYNLATGRRTRLPAAVDTGADETSPKLSRGRLLFARTQEVGFAGRDLRYQVMLYNLSTGKVRTVDSALLPYGALTYPRLEIGQLNGRYAVWDRRWENLAADGETEVTHGRVVLYDLRTGTRTTFLRHDGMRLSDPAVSADGTLYYLRTTVRPGGSTDIVRRPPGSSRGTTIATLAPGHTAAGLYVDDTPSGAHAVFYAVRTTTGTTDVFKILDRTNTFDRADPAHDVVVYDEDTEVIEPVPANKSVDITAASFRHSNTQVDVTIRLRDYTGGAWDWEENIKTPHGWYQASAGKDEPWSSPAVGLYRGENRVDCPGMSLTITPTLNTFLLSIPNTCMNEPRWVRINGILERLEPARYIDSAMRTGWDYDSGPLTPRLYGG